jgi:hypothetical protein
VPIIFLILPVCCRMTVLLHIESYKERSILFFTLINGELCSRFAEEIVKSLCKIPIIVLMLCFTFVVYMQLLMMFTLIFMVTHSTCFGLIVQVVSIRELLYCFSIIIAMGFF